MANLLGGGGAGGALCYPFQGQKDLDFDWTFIKGRIVGITYLRSFALQLGLKLLTTPSRQHNSILDLDAEKYSSSYDIKKPFNTIIQNVLLRFHNKFSEK